MDPNNRQPERSAASLLKNPPKLGVFESFAYAFQGLLYVLRTQRHMRFHFVAAILALLVAALLGLSKIETVILFLTITLVLIAEMINTCLECIVDMVREDFHPLAKVAKDVAAGCVLIAAANSLVVALVILFPKIVGFWLP